MRILRLKVTVFLLTAISVNVCAQKKVKFFVSDTVSKVTLHDATIKLLDNVTGKYFSGKTDDNGEFLFDAPLKHRIKFSVSYVGFKTFTGDLFIKQDTIVKIFLSDDINLLNEITVRGRKNLELKPDRLIYYVNRSEAQGKNAVDILRNVPYVSITGDNMLIKGNSAYQILQNGRISTLTLNDLRAMPASRLQSIELITIPSAKYDGQYQAILNVKLRKDDDYIGDISFARLGTRNSGIGSTFTKTNKKENTMVSVNWGYDATRSTSNYHTTISKDTLFNIDQVSKSNQKMPSFGAKYYSEFTLADNEYLGLGVDLDLATNKSSSEYNAEIDPLNLITHTNNQTNLNSYDIGFAANYSKKIGKMNKLSFSNLVKFNNNQYLLKSTNSTSGFIIKNKNANTEITSQLDDEIAVRKGTDIEIGEKVIYRSYLHTPIYIDSLDSKFDYKQTILACYLSMSQQLKQFYLRVGARMEQTLDYYDSQHNNMLDLMPNVLLSYAANSNKTDMLNLSFRQSVSRPGFQLLSIFADRGTPLNITIGNPNLKNEVNNTLRLGNDLILGDNNISYGFIYSFAKHLINSEKFISSAYFTQTEFDNSGSSNSLGMEGSYNRPLLKNKLYINFSGSLKYYSIIGFNETNNGWISDCNAGISYNPSDRLSIDFYASYLGNYISLQSYTGHTVFSDLMVRYQVKRSSFLIQFTNPIINRINESSKVIAPFYHYSGNSTFFGRNLAIGYAYSFGKTKDRDNETREVENNDLIDIKTNKKL